MSITNKLRDLKIKMSLTDCPKPDKKFFTAVFKDTKMIEKEYKGIFNWIFNKVSNIYSTNRWVDVDEKMYKELQDLSKYGVITGSVVLKLHGLLNRSVGDIDLIVTNENLELLKNDYEEIYMDHYDDPDINIVCALDYKGYKLDLFIGDDDYIEYDGIKMEHPYSVIQNKIKLGRDKDMEDLLAIKI